MSNMQRIHDIYRPTDERRTDWREVETMLSDAELKEQTSRCMNCGQPFCHAYGCPLGNFVPDQNRAVAQGDWRRAYALLSANSDFPEFTSRICPALCEASCVHGLDDEAVMIRQSEKRIIETAFANGWVEPRPPARENGKSVAVIGAGPSGLSAAVTLRRRGWSVTVYERRDNIGGLLRYGIPCFKLDKALIDRRRKVLEAEGIRFVTGCEIGRDVSAEWLARRYDALVLAIGTPAARDLKIPGRELGGIHLALELLEGQNRFLTGEIPAPPICAEGKEVLVIGGGDTGSDCVGTAIRQGAKSVTQIEIMPRPPDLRDASTPWPLWPYMLRTSSSHKEGCERRWNLNSLRFVESQKSKVESPGDINFSTIQPFNSSTTRPCVVAVEVETVDWEFSPEGRPMKFHAVPGTKETIKADLVFLAMGFTGVPTDNPIVAQLGLAQTPRTALIADPSRKIYCVGDCANGASLVVRALADGKSLPLD
ncbi:MAG: glutamate synthase subunit beta [Kiritimatiellae bacterium]|nr:glutamate synthase subunit beta [Kiritimatiellia bacterium]